MRNRLALAPTPIATSGVAQRADFTDAVVVIEHQPTTLGKVCHHIMKDSVDLRMLYSFPLARALEVLLKLYFFIIQFTLLG